MTLNERIEKEYIDAYKSKNQLKLDVLRLLKTAAKNVLVELKRSTGTLNDEEMMDVILRQAKQRQDSIIQYRDASRNDLAEREVAELGILQEYLPTMLSEDELQDAIAQAIAETGASSPKEMGKVMSVMTAKYKGRFDGKELSTKVRASLA